MNNQVTFPSGGVGEIYLDVFGMYWYYYESSQFNIGNEIPFLKVILDLASLRMRYYRGINRSKIEIPQIIKDIGKHSPELVRSFIKIKSLSEDLFSTGDIVTVHYCIEVYRHFINKEPFDLFIYGAQEIRGTFYKLQIELENFLQKTERLFILFFRLLPLNSSFKKNPNGTHKKFIDNLKEQFDKFIILDGKYSSGQFTNMDVIFSERMYR